MGAKFGSYYIFQIISSATLEEWCVVWDNLTRHIPDVEILYSFYEAVQMIGMSVEDTRTAATRACLFYCIQNLVYIIRYKFFQGRSLTDRRVVCVMYSLSKFLQDTNIEDVEEIGSRLMPLFAFLVEKKNLYTSNVASYFRNTNYYALVCRAFNIEQSQENGST